MESELIKLIVKGAVIVMATLSAYRMARMAALEEGPFNLCYLLRKKVREDVGNHPKLSWIAGGVECPYCTSFWCAALCAILLSWQGVIPHYYLHWFWGGIAGAVALMFMAGEPRAIKFENRLVEHVYAAASPENHNGHNGNGREQYAELSRGLREVL